MSGIRVALAQASDSARWDAVVLRSAVGTIYHRFAWHEVYRKTAEPRYFIATDQERAVGVFPAVETERDGVRTLHSLPQGVGGLCVDDRVDDRFDVARALIAAAIGLARNQRCHILEIKADVRLADLYSGCTRTRYALGHAVNLSRGWDDIWSRGFKKKARKYVRQAEKAGCVTRIYGGEEVTDERFAQFYRMHESVSERHGQEPIDPAMFCKIRSVLARESHLCVTYHGKAPVAARFFLCDPEANTVALYMGASDSDYWKFYPNDLGYANTIRWAAENGYGSVDLGLSPYPSATSGHAHFKGRWGADEYQVDLLQWKLRPASLVLRRVIRRSRRLVTQARSGILRARASTGK